jgi:hypothetical protein
MQGYHKFGRFLYCCYACLQIRIQCQQHPPTEFPYGVLYAKKQKSHALTGWFLLARRVILLRHAFKIIRYTQNILASCILFYSLNRTLVVYSECSEIPILLSVGA